MNRRNKQRPIRLTRIVFTLVMASLSPLAAAQETRPPKQQMISLNGRTLAAVDYLAGSLRGAFGDHYEVFVFGREPLNRDRPIVAVKIMYKFLKSEPALPGSFLDFSKRYEIQVIREPSCDETLRSLSYQKSSDEMGKQLSIRYILRPLGGTPKEIFKQDRVLKCYILRPGKYRLLSQGSQD